MDDRYNVVVDGTRKILFTGTRHACERWIFTDGHLNVVYALKKAKKEKVDENIKSK